MKVAIKDNLTKTVTKVENVFWISEQGDGALEVCYVNSVGKQSMMIFEKELDPSITVYVGKEKTMWKERSL